MDRQRGRRSAVLAMMAALAAVIAGCGANGGAGGGAQPTGGPAAGTASTGTASNLPANGTTGGSRGFDCAVLITPAELDTISGFTGGTVTTRTRGDQNPDTPGYGECGFEEPAVSNWGGSIAISSGPAIDGYEVQYEFNKENGGTVLSGLGPEALMTDTDAGLNMFAKSSDGVGILIGLAFDLTDMSKDEGKAALRKILETVLSRV